MKLLAAVTIFLASNLTFADQCRTLTLDRKYNWGLNSIDAPSAWVLATGKNSVNVAVVDTGIDVGHPDLRGKLWVGEDGSHGWDFVNNTPFLSLNAQHNLAHGTHVAGLIAATNDPDHGVAGVAKFVRLMSVNFYKEASTGRDNTARTVKAINWAVDNGAAVINYSSSGEGYAAAEYEAIARAATHNVLIVTAAGNDHRLVGDTYKTYPASHALPNIISVAATDQMDTLTDASNYGRIDVAAPGIDVLSTFPSNRYGHMSGTSQATAFVTGVAALLLAENPRLRAPELRAIIMRSVDKIEALRGKVRSDGKVNACKALVSLKTHGSISTQFTF